MRVRTGKPLEPGLSHLRVSLGGDLYIGPGRADLLELIERTGSIADAAKAMGMSYKRAWTLVQALNAAASVPLVETSRGGAGQGGAILTPDGAELIRRYRLMQHATRDAIAEHVSALSRLPRR